MITDLQQMIANGELNEAIIKLRKILNKSPLLNEIITQSARYNELKKKIRLGTIDMESADISKNKITLALLEMVSEMNLIIEDNPEMNKDFNDESEEYKIKQVHHGKGDNIGGNKIINHK